MSILVDKVDKATNRYVDGSVKVRKANPKKDAPSFYNPTDIERQAINAFLDDFRLGWQTMHLPRAEFNDLSLYQRHIVDMLGFNNYQENDGQPMLEDRLGGWKSEVMRPILRNKAVSIAAHETARLTVPKIFAFDDQDEEQADSAKVMSYLVDYARDDAGYGFQAVFRVIQSLYSPISWGYSEYTEQYRTVKDTKGEDGQWTYRQELDESESGFRHLPVPTDQVFFGNFYERDVQRQDFIIWRRVMPFERARAMFGSHPNFVHVKPGVLVTLDDANTGFYQVYDPHMQGQDVEVLIRWRKGGNTEEPWNTDSRLAMVNGVLVSEPDAANPRMDHAYPWDAFYYLPINERCLAGKSLVFAMGPEAALLNAQYQMVNDAGKMTLFPPTITTGSDKIGADVMVPGLSLAFAEKDVEVKTLSPTNTEALMAMMKVMEQVETSLNQSSQDPVQQGQNPGTPSTAYEISRIEQNAATVLGLSMKFITQHAVDYGKLLLSDILQYLTVADAEQITAEDGLMYKTFFSKVPGQPGQMNKVSFSGDLPEGLMTDEEELALSFAIAKKQGGIKSTTRLYLANPVAFRSFKYRFTVDSDVENPRSADLERAMDLETYDRAIASPVADQEKLYKDLLMATNPKTARDPENYVAKQAPQIGQPGPMALPNGSVPGGPQQTPPAVQSTPQPLSAKGR
jgi:hypothetical protein